MSGRIFLPAPERPVADAAQVEKAKLALRQENGRLVARLKRDVAKAEKAGEMSDDRARKMAATIHRLIDVERRLEDPWRRWPPVTTEDLLARLRLMAPGAGMVVPGERDFEAQSTGGVILP